MKRQLLAFLVGLILVVGVAEVAMRIAAIARGRSSSSATQPAAKNFGPAFKIIVLGESTSWSSDLVDVSWSARLREGLQKHFEANGIKRTVQVINLARSGVSSTLLVEHLVETLETMTPDAVITMMGINDTVALYVERGFLFSKSFVARFIYWSLVSLRCPNCYRVSNQFVDDNPVDKPPEEVNRFIFGLQSTKFASAKDLETADLAYRQMKQDSKSMQLDPDWEEKMDILWGVWLYSRSEAPDLNQSGKSVNEAFGKRQRELRREFLLLADHYFERARRVVVRLKGSIKQNCFVLNRLRKWPQPCLDLVKDGLRSGVVLTPDFLALAVSAAAEQDPELQPSLEAHGYSIANSQKAVEATANSYRRVLALQKQHGFMWFAMQYPKGSIAGLKLLLGPDAKSLNGFSDVFNYSQTSAAAPVGGSQADTNQSSEGVVFVSNENFNALVTPDNEAEYFKDMFARGAGSEFGHTTQKGHALIAENALQAMIQHLDLERLR